MSAMLWQQADRADRFVQRARLRLPLGEPRSRVAFALEEALRLTTLPGEEQGRAYYFRRVSLNALPSAAPRSLWLDSCRRSLRSIAERAIHGRDSRAANAEAVYFISQQDALEWFLGRLLTMSASTAAPAPTASPWFAPMVSGVRVDEPLRAQFVAVIERLRQLPSGWFAAAIAIFSSPDSVPAGVASVLASVPAYRVRQWLVELGWSSGAASAPATPLPAISSAKRQILRRVLAASGSWPGAASYTPASSGQAAATQPEPQLIWFAALAIASEHSAELNSGSILASACTLIEQLRQSALPEGEFAEAARAPRMEQVNPQPSPGSAEKAEAERRVIPVPQILEPEPAPAYALDPSQPTEAAGLYFLLNALRPLGIESALQTAPQLARYGFLPRLILAIAAKARVTPGDGALEWANFELEQVGARAPSVQASECWPRNLPAPPLGFSIEAKALLRVWTLAVRRWCWRVAGLKLSEIINRPGRILLARADLDVTLSLEFADLRIRRVGLDLDPGWLPWFGRVVRFHYERADSAQRTPLQRWRDGGMQ